MFAKFAVNRRSEIADDLFLIAFADVILKSLEGDAVKETGMVVAKVVLVGCYEFKSQGSRC